MDLRELISIFVANPVLIGLSAGVFGAFIGAVATILNTLISTNFQERRDKQQWTRDKMQEIYANSLFNISLLERVIGVSDDEKENAVRELIKWLNLLLIYHPFRKKKDYEELRDKIRHIMTAWENVVLITRYKEKGFPDKDSLDNAKESMLKNQEKMLRLSSELKSEITNLATNDPRLGQ
jgi:hypothetical protein